MPYKVEIIYPGGTSEELDEIFESEEEATDYGLQSIGDYRLGNEILHLSNPGDHPLSDEDADFRVFGV